ncbi:zinc-finger domain-containing protein [Bacillus sp. sid0103]|uniref:zinc-finger domain-containing protein n=1 Tax=Bacillus sp. sid0103 TaxID=2856337 RepID=UPI001C47604E|nr:zinc-finger domain-containing protein [Bacillus sp. sid0103]MBV7508026.1 zinc-finger domain-containing protein [Bacillus sp. sid0103]
MKELNRRELLSHVESLMTQYCEGCFLHQHLKKEGGRRAAHRFCISQCTIGEQLQKYGKKLS